MLQSLVASFETDPSALLRAICPLPLAASLRHTAVVALHSAVKVRCAALTCNGMIGVACSRSGPESAHVTVLSCTLPA